MAKKWPAQAAGSGREGYQRGGRQGRCRLCCGFNACAAVAACCIKFGFPFAALRKQDSLIFRPPLATRLTCILT